VKTYFLYLHDDRYTVLNLDTISAHNDRHAAERAAWRLASSPHYRAVEVWEDERLVCRLDRAADPSAI
jgi:hypothetical protein